MIRLTNATLIGACAIVLGSVTAGYDQSLPRDQPHGRAAGEPNEGRIVALGGLYGEQRIACVQCHGLDGAGDSSGAFPRLSGQSAWYLYKTLHDYASGLRNNHVMSPIARTLSDRQMRDVASHYAAVEAAPVQATADVSTSVRQIGGAIAAAGIPERGVPACNGCHGVEGRGVPPIYPALAGQYAPYTQYQMLLWKAGQRNGDPMNIMAIIAGAMTEEQIKAVAAYYAAVLPRQIQAGERSQDSAASVQTKPQSESTGIRETNILGLNHAPGTRPPPAGVTQVPEASAPSTAGPGRERGK